MICHLSIGPQRNSQLGLFLLGSSSCNLPNILEVKQSCPLCPFLHSICVITKMCSRIGVANFLDQSACYVAEAIAHIDEKLQEASGFGHVHDPALLWRFCSTTKRIHSCSRRRAFIHGCSIKRMYQGLRLHAVGLLISHQRIWSTFLLKRKKWLLFSILGRGKNMVTLLAVLLLCGTAIAEVKKQIFAIKVGSLWEIWSSALSLLELWESGCTSIQLTLGIQWR